MKARMTVTVDPKTLREAKIILKETGLTLSGFVNVTLQGLVDSNQKSFRKMYEDMAVALVKEITEPHGKRKGSKKT